MDRHLIDYLPPVLRDVLEFRTVNEAVEPEYASAWADLERLLDNQFLDTADETGVGAWERELGITPDIVDTLEGRKIRLFAAWNLTPPYTTTWLRNWLADICGPAGHREAVNGYLVDIELDRSVLPNAVVLETDILNVLTAVLPANMQVVCHPRYLLLQDVHGVMTLGELEETILDSFAGGSYGK